MSLEHLLELQKIDLSLDSISFKRTKNEFSESIERLKVEANTLMKEQQQSQEILAVQRAELNVASEKSQSIRDRIDKINAQLFSSTIAPGDALNLSHEMDACKTSLQQADVYELELLEVVEKQELKNEVVEKKVETLRANYASQNNQLNSFLEELQLEQTKLEAQKSELIAEIDTSLLAIYEPRVLGEIKIARLEGRRCGACHMELSSMEYESARGSNSQNIVKCSDCGSVFVS